jgi:hypothetical protein
MIAFANLQRRKSGCATFQANILPPSKTDIVLCVLRAPIGMRLPEDYKRADGAVPTGTEWEFEDANASYKLNGTPDLYVYRKTANPTIEATSEESLEEWGGQKRALDLFFERWFRNHDGAFKAGFNTFQRDEELGKMLEQHLEKVINQRIQQEEGYSPAWATFPPRSATERLDQMRPTLRQRGRCQHSLV